MTELESRLENWGRVMRDSWRQGCCRSIEHRYVPERGIEAMESRQSPRPVLNRKDADLIEEAWRTIYFRRDKQVLKLAYVWRAPADFICRRLAIEVGQDGVGYQLALAKAQRAIKRELEDIPWRRTREYCS